MIDSLNIAVFTSKFLSLKICFGMRKCTKTSEQSKAAELLRGSTVMACDWLADLIPQDSRQLSSSGDVSQSKILSSCQATSLLSVSLISSIDLTCSSSPQLD